MVLVTLHALCLLGMPCATALFCLKRPIRNPSAYQFALAGILAITAGILILSLNAHLCTAGDPFSQCAIGSLCLWAVLAFVQPRRLRWITGGCILLLTGLLSDHYVDLVHEPQWVGRPSSLRAALAAKNESCLRWLDEELRDTYANDPTEYPEGWLRNLPLPDEIQDMLRNAKPVVPHIHRTWHTWWTRLYRVDRQILDFWYPGGRFANAADRITLRNRP